MLTGKKFFRFLAIGLAIGVLFQSWQLYSVVKDDLLAVYGTIGQGALWRSANFRVSQKFADYILFLNANIPEDGRVVLPPQGGGNRVVRITPFMQFFLAPRQVINCLDMECIQGVDRQNTYIPFTSSTFPGRLALKVDQVLHFDKEWGLVMPLDARQGEGLPYRGFQSIFTIIMYSLGPAIWFIALTITGYISLKIIFPGWSFTQKVVLGYGLGMLFLTLSVSIISLTGIPLSRDIIILISFVLFTSVISLFLLSRRESPKCDLVVSTPRAKWINNGSWLLMFLLLGLVATLISIGKGYHTTDAIQIWGAKGYGIAATGGVWDVMSWGTNSVHYPLHVPVFVASSHLLFGENLPASKMFFSAYYVALLYLIYLMLLDDNLRSSIAGLGALLVGTAPLIFRHATIGYANLPLAFYLTAGVYLLIKTVELSDRRESYSLAIMCGVFFGGASWTRPEGLALSLACVILLLSLGYFYNRLKIRHITLVLAPMFIYGLFWLLVKSMVYTRPAANSALALTAMNQIMVGDMHLADAWYVLRNIFIRLIDISTWGVFGIVILLFLISFAITLSKRLVTVPFSLWVGLLILILIFGIYYLTSFDMEHDISWWVSTGLDRMVFPGLILLWIGVISVLKVLDDYENSSASADAE